MSMQFSFPSTKVDHLILCSRPLCPLLWVTYAPVVMLEIVCSQSDCILPFVTVKVGKTSFLYQVKM
jgi:hypothetical protein